MRVDTTSYQFAHGKKPTGGKVWAFKIGDVVRIFHGKFSVAKKEAIAYARTVNVTTVIVLT